MSLTSRFSRIFVLLTFAISSLAMSAAQDSAGAGNHVVIAKMKLDERSMIVVPVSINGSGPYDFLLDTGSSKSMIDRRLADQLSLPKTGEKTVIGMLASVRMSIVHVDSLSVAGATVGGGEMFSSDQPATVTGKVRGVLGEDFLQNFDVLLDYRHQSIGLEPPLGAMARSAVGEHLPLQLNEIYRGKAIRNRLVLSGRIEEFGDAAMSLVLDSGANQLTLFRDNLGPGSYAERINMGNFNQWAGSVANVRRVRSLNLGDSSVPDLTVVALPRRADVDSDGLIPTSFFHSIFISSHGGFVILNPSFPKAVMAR